MNDPLTKIEAELAEKLHLTLKKLKLQGEVKLQKAKDHSFGDYNSPVFPLAKPNKKSPQEIAKNIAEAFPKTELLSNVSAKGGFVNYSLNRSYCARAILSAILSDKNFHKSDTKRNERIIVEHTSANPNGPIHIGNFRGSIIGDTYAKILKTVGAKVTTHFYVDDLGHQIPVLVIGYELLKKYDYPIDEEIKMDHFLGKVYSINHTMYDIQRLKQKLVEKLELKGGQSPYWLTEQEMEKIQKALQKKEPAEKEKHSLLKELKFIFNIQQDIHKRTTKIYDFLKDCLEKEQIDLVTAIPDLNRRYINKETEAVKAVRTTCQDVLDGQKEQLALMGIHHDHFDWEADLEWSGKVEKVLENIDENGYLIKEGKARLVDVNEAANLKGAREYLNLKKDYEVPKAILVTSKGDSLYLLRDIAYSIKKVDHYNADQVFNVIGKGQELTQTQLNLAVRAAGREDVANKLLHLNYEFMELKGALTSMSARRMQYITPLELFNQTKHAVRENFLKERDYPEKEKEKIAEIVAVGAIKYSIIAIGLMKKLIFDPEKVVSLHDNTSPFIQYAYARSQNILAKTDFSWKKEQVKNLEKLIEIEEWVLVLTLGELPRIIREAAEQIKPEIVCTYLFELANLFNKFYDSHRVLDAPSKELINARLALTTAVGKIIARGLDLLSIESPKRM